ncbi:uncharacterized protein LOC118506950 isoform X1 [Anopheles stephensi]|uniref:uncharacterized protein LOC118506950 isoform X1 n=1 Tax=Anopheles stephensi TaxID=30069 RepID=UPI0016589561|nr:uncharacterized protein LOC118506950 isoform X1 [Anopheles stephensi]
MTIMHQNSPFDEYPPACRVRWWCIIHERVVLNGSRPKGSINTEACVSGGPPVKCVGRDLRVSSQTQAYHQRNPSKILPPTRGHEASTSGSRLCSHGKNIRLVQAIFWLPGYLEKNQEQLYRRVEQRSGLASDDRMQQAVDKRFDELTGKELDESTEKATILEEKGENDAVECEADSKKDK